jgi:2,3-bisphosphoglycerate-independent phosphoglycerate mutase
VKYIVILGDGMADYPIDTLGGKTPLEAAFTPNIDALAAKSTLGMVKTVKDNFPPGSDIANMAVLGLDPSRCYTGRAPIEAVSIGVDLADDDTAFRINFVNLVKGDEGDVMNDYSAGHISTGETGELIRDLKPILMEKHPEISIYHGVEYRHLMVIKGFNNPDLKTTPPHDIAEQAVGQYRPNDDLLINVIDESTAALKDHQINTTRKEEGKKEATCLWPWGQGTRMKVPTLKEEFNITGAMISAVDLLKGLGKLRGMDIVDVPGATGWIDTDYEGKANAALEALKTHDFVYVHIEAPDEAGHGGYLKEKVKAIEDIDSRLMSIVLAGLDRAGEPYRLLFMPDHPTPIAKKTHTPEPVPFLLYDSREHKSVPQRFTENDARASGLFIEKGYTILKMLLEIKDEGVVPNPVS